MQAELLSRREQVGAYELEFFLFRQQQAEENEKNNYARFVICSFRVT